MNTQGLSDPSSSAHSHSRSGICMGSREEEVTCDLIFEGRTGGLQGGRGGHTRQRGPDRAGRQKSHPDPGLERAQSGGVSQALCPACLWTHFCPWPNRTSVLPEAVQTGASRSRAGTQPRSHGHTAWAPGDSTAGEWVQGAGRCVDGPRTDVDGHKDRTHRKRLSCQPS